ncbi:hypothetical protein Mgra_00000229 [Meloidogyne graminicola]|uniref:Uncharacterized protein n=1 Tax=Meloidogyne graminicola TaxID=189291 RepID=A0A8T0A522_9BILA|nr:hypothetical protein Mgra_00000229 [Meloidogyne graminicola]
MFLNYLIIPKKPRRQFLPLSLSEWDLYCRRKRKIKLNSNIWSKQRSKSVEQNLYNENQKTYQNIKFRNRAITTTTGLLKEKRNNNYLCVEDRMSIASSTCSAPLFTQRQSRTRIAQRFAKRSKSLIKILSALQCRSKSTNNEERKKCQFFDKSMENKEKEENKLIENIEKNRKRTKTSKSDQISNYHIREVHWQMYQSRLQLKMSSTKL